MSEKSPPPESLLPYEAWSEDAMREVALRALEHAAAHGLPGEHHFYLSYRTDHPGVAIPGHLKAKYPEEITIVLQHQYDDLFVDRVAERFGVTLHFGGVPAKLVIPFGALTMFHDPHVRFGLRFTPSGMEEEAASLPPAPEAPPAPPPPAAAPQGEVVSLDAFRRRPNKDGG
ncbi:MAG: hypothetical protein RLZZ57_3152 [Pseudomonadota bacterium]|jgi:uncharacterized protein|nr:hypothetical protein [Acetobacteraceae bacterium]